MQIIENNTPFAEIEPSFLAKRLASQRIWRQKSQIHKEYSARAWGQWGPRAGGGLPSQRDALNPQGAHADIRKVADRASLHPKCALT